MYADAIRACCATERKVDLVDVEAGGVDDGGGDGGHGGDGDALLRRALDVFAEASCVLFLTFLQARAFCSGISYRKKTIHGLSKKWYIEMLNIFPIHHNIEHSPDISKC